MFPNIRLMIAATFAAVLMLIFGFGMFATFRVSHAPLERVASAASLHLVTADAATPPLSVAAAAPFNNRFAIDEPGSGSVTALAYATPEQAAAPDMNVAVPAVANAVADDHEQAAAELEPATPSTANSPASADDPAPLQQAAVSDAEPETKAAEGGAAGPAAPADSTIVLGVSLIAEPAPAEPAEALPDLATKAMERAEQAEKAEKKAKRARAARSHHAYKARAVAEASGFDAQTTFQTARSWTQQESQKLRAKIRHAKSTSTAPAATAHAAATPASTKHASETHASETRASETPDASTPDSTPSGDTPSGVGGPFVSMPGK